MKFFKQIEAILDGGFDLNLAMRKSGDRITVSILPKPQKNEASKEGKVDIIPLIMTGTANELDQGFLGQIQKAKAETMDTVVSMNSFEANLKRQTDKAKGTGKSKPKAKTAPEGQGSLFNK